MNQAPESFGSNVATGETPQLPPAPDWSNVPTPVEPAEPQAEQPAEAGDTQAETSEANPGESPLGSRENPVVVDGISSQAGIQAVKFNQQ